MFTKCHNSIQEPTLLKKSKGKWFLAVFRTHCVTSGQQVHYKSKSRRNNLLFNMKLEEGTLLLCFLTEQRDQMHWIYSSSPFDFFLWFIYWAVSKGITSQVFYHFNSFQNYSFTAFVFCVVDTMHHKSKLGLVSLHILGTVAPEPLQINTT